jgi:hypothetical protein
MYCGSSGEAATSWPLILVGVVCFLTTRPTLLPPDEFQLTLSPLFNVFGTDMPLDAVERPTVLGRAGSARARVRATHLTLSCKQPNRVAGAEGLRPFSALRHRSADMIRVGIGGWVYEPWRGTFYPPDLPKTQEFAYACSKVTSIEVNATFYRTQTPATYRKWADESPDGFVFSLKGPRYVSNRRVLAEAGPMVDAFLNSGIAELRAPRLAARTHQEVRSRGHCRFPASPSGKP